MESVFDANARGDRQQIYWGIIAGILSVAFAIYLMVVLGFFERRPANSQPNPPRSNSESIMLRKHHVAATMC